MSIRLDERRYVEELKRLVADFRMWKNPLVPLPDGFEDDLAWSNVAFLRLQRGVHAAQGQERL